MVRQPRAAHLRRHNRVLAHLALASLVHRLADFFLYAASVMRIDPKLFRPKSLKVKIDGLASELLELISKTEEYDAKCARLCSFKKLQSATKVIGFSQPVPQVFFKKLVKLLKPMKAIDSDMSLLV